jgi:hypothetical protein
MKTFEVTVTDCIPTKIQAKGLEDALRHAKTIMGYDAQWDLHHIFEGEKRVTAYFKLNGIRFALEVFNTAFKR